MPQDFIISGQTLTDIGDAIREKGGAEGGLTPEAMPSAIRSIPSVQDVQVAGVSVLEGGIANVPMANKGVLGVSSVDNYSIGTTNTGVLFLYNSRKGDIDARSANIALTPYNLDYAVKAAMCDGKGPAWTANEQKAARERMGIDKPYELIEEITLTEKVTQLSRNAEPNGTPYNFRKMYVSIITPQAEEDGLFYSYFNGTLVGIAVNSIRSAVPEGGVAQIYAHVADGFLDGYGVGAENQGTSSNVARYVTTANVPSGISAINSINIFATVNIPINTSIAIYGVRA